MIFQQISFLDNADNILKINQYTLEYYDNLHLRSSVYMEIFPDDEMIEAFGHLQPSLSERNAYFFDKWMEWRS